MFLWNVSQLKSELASKQLPESTAFVYFMIWFVAVSAGALARLSNPAGDVTTWTYVVNVVAFLIAVLGTLACYRVNSGGQFFIRYFSLKIVVGFRFMVAAVPLFFAERLLLVALGFRERGWLQPLELALSLAVLLIYYWRLVIHFSDVAAFWRGDSTVDMKQTGFYENGSYVGQEDPVYRGPWPSRESEAVVKELGLLGEEVEFVDREGTFGGGRWTFRVLWRGRVPTR